MSELSQEQVDDISAMFRDCYLAVAEKYFKGNMDAMMDHVAVSCFMLIKPTPEEASSRPGKEKAGNMVMGKSSLLTHICASILQEVSRSDAGGGIGYERALHSNCLDVEAKALGMDRVGDRWQDTVIGSEQSQKIIEAFREGGLKGLKDLPPEQ